MPDSGQAVETLARYVSLFRSYTHRGWEEFSFPHSVRFLIGENASRKSTLIEPLALAAGPITVGGSDAPGRDQLL